MFINCFHAFIYHLRQKKCYYSNRCFSYTLLYSYGKWIRCTDLWNGLLIDFQIFVWNIIFLPSPKMLCCWNGIPEIEYIIYSWGHTFWVNLHYMLWFWGYFDSKGYPLKLHYAHGLLASDKYELDLLSEALNKNFGQGTTKISKVKLQSLDLNRIIFTLACLKWPTVN